MSDDLLKALRERVVEGRLDPDLESLKKLYDLGDISLKELDDLVACGSVGRAVLDGFARANEGRVQERKQREDVVRQILDANPGLSTKGVQEQLRKRGHDLGLRTVQRYRRQAFGLSRASATS